jgi:ATP-dependent DNA helicase PIF1
MDTLTTEQRLVFDELQKGRNVFLTGRGGTGKSYLITTIYNELPLVHTIKKGCRIAITAMTGCAAVLLGRRAKTLHSWAGIGLGRGTAKELIVKIRKSPRAMKNWLCTDLLVIDELSMMPAELLEKLDEIGRIVRRNGAKPFGGIQLLLVGDFLQLPPVVRGDEDLRFAFETPLWSDLTDCAIELTISQRQKDEQFQRILGEIRIGELSQESADILEERRGLPWQQLKIRPTLLFPRRAEVDMINESNLKVLAGNRQNFKAGIAFKDKIPIGFDPQNPEFIRSLEAMDKEANYSTELVLAVGAQVMLISNLDVEKGLVNGSRGVIVELSGSTDAGGAPLVEFRNGLIIPINRDSWEIEGWDGVMRTQIPLRLAWAVTIHKCQGATLDCALVDIGRNVFEYGQAYVALSRVRDLEALYVHDFEPRAIRAHPRVIEFYQNMAPAAVPSTATLATGARCNFDNDPVEDNSDYENNDNWLWKEIPAAWKQILAGQQQNIIEIADKLQQYEANATILPPREDIWTALSLVKPNDVRVVILGQDPYPTPGHAHGLAFSTREGTYPIPASLRNIFRELAADIANGQDREKNGKFCLRDWAQQGVLLLNTILTVEAGKPQSHAGIGWEQITDRILLGLRGRGVVFVLWGKIAQKKKELLGGDGAEIIIESAHPSPLSCTKGFYGSRPFSAINGLLRGRGEAEIIWN